MAASSGMLKKLCDILTKDNLAIWKIAVASLLVMTSLLFPHFGRTYEIIHGWYDQSFYQRILNLADSEKIGEALDFNYMGPSYIAMAQVLKSAFALDSTGALVLLNRSFVALAIAAPAMAYGLAGKFDARRLAAMVGAFLVFLLSTPFMFSSSIPWSHYVAGMPAVIFVLALLLPTRPAAFVAGISWGLLATIRLFEAQALLGLTAAYLGLITIRKPTLFKNAPALIVLAAAGAVLGYGAHAAVLGEFQFYAQYNGLQDYDGYKGSLLNFRDLPVKFMQFFVDPCFYALCRYADFKKTTTFVFQSDPGLLNWRLPFVLQLPFYAGSLVAGLLVLVKRPALFGALLREPVLFVSLGAAVCIPLAYLSYMIGGSAQLKYGFVREMFVPALCLLIAISHLLARPLLRSSEKNLLFWSLALTAIIGLQVVPMSYGYPRLTSTHIARIEASENCASDSCALSLSYFNPSGREITIPFDRFALVRQDCAGETVFQGVADLVEFRYSPSECAGTTEITALSTTTGASRFVRKKIGGQIDHETEPDTASAATEE